MAAHQQFMNNFIDAHKQVMLTYLQGGGPASQQPPDLRATQPPLEAAPPMDPASRLPLVEHAADLSARVSDVAQSSSGNGDQAAPPDASALAEEPPLPTDPPAGDPLARIATRLLDVVADRTGYPPEMLDLNLDLEADLGIDSIKRIEILGTLQNEGLLPGDSEGGDMEALAKLSTLQAILDWIGARAADASPANAPAGESGNGETTPTAASAPRKSAAEEAPAIDPQRVPRMVLEAVEVAPARASAPSGRGLVVVTDDGAGVAAAVSDRLRERGWSPVMLENPADVLGDRSRAQTWLEQVRQARGAVAGVLHVAPLADRAMLRQPVTEWSGAVERNALAFFNLLQLAADDLRGAEEGRLVAALPLDGQFGLTKQDPEAFWPGAAALGGVVKSAAREWDSVRCRVVDCGPTQSADAVADLLIAEWDADDSLLEVGYCDDRRWTLAPRLAELGREPAPIALDEDSVALVTGGARGITAQVALALAERRQGRFVLVGRSPLPVEGESAETAGVEEPKALKAALRAQLEARGEQATPAAVEAAYRRIHRDREMRSTLAAMHGAGVEVEYHAVDVADGAAFGALIDDLYARFGRIDVVIHGAGVIEDKLLVDKSADSLRRVMAPKVAGAHVFLEKLNPASLRCLAFFSSVSGRYGNRGQADYAAANEVLNKLARRLNAQWPARVVAFNWGPWRSSGGMVSDALAKQFAAAGVHMIEPQAGCAAFLDELERGAKDDVEVILGGPLRLPSPETLGAGPPVEATPRPLLATAVRQRRQTPQRTELVRTLDPNCDLYLRDHQLDGKCVMPMAMVLELFAETAASLRPDMRLVSVRDHRVLRGLALDHGPLTLQVSAEVLDEDAACASVALTLRCDDRPEPRYLATAWLRKAPDHAPRVSRLTLTDPRPLPLSLAAAYEDWLFHGPLFAGIREVEAVGRNGIIGRLHASDPAAALADDAPGAWMIDPVVIDSGLQMIILWARTNLDMTPLPARLGAYHRYAETLSGELRCEASIAHTPGNPAIMVDIKFFDASGRLAGWIERLEATCSTALNRLAAGGVVSA